MQTVTPFYIVTFNRLKGLIHALNFAGRSTIPIQPVIIDMGSTWSPFLEYLDSVNGKKIVISQGIGPRDLWTNGILEQIGEGGFFLSDGDLDYSSVPSDTFEKVMELSRKYPWIPKVGIGLKTEDLPIDLEGDRIRNWDKGNMQFEIEKEIYLSSLDTTFAYYPNRKTSFHYRPALRIGGRYRASHYPWYERRVNFDAEAIFYYEKANPNISSGKRAMNVTYLVRVKKAIWSLIFSFSKYLIRFRTSGLVVVKLLSIRGTIPKYEK